jgi:hypothetical protein
MPMIKPGTIFLILTAFIHRYFQNRAGSKTSDRMKKILGLFAFIMALQPSFSQTPGKVDSLFASGDTTAIMDSLLKDFDSYLDSLTGSRSFFSVNLGVGTGFFSFNEKNTSTVNTQRKLLFSPSIGYYHKSGLGISTTGFAINEENKLNMYQFSVSPSYDLIKRSLSTGISYTKYFTKDSLNFYNTPIQNELFVYFSYKKWWVRPTINFSYGWGSREEYEKRKLSRLAYLLSLSRDYYVVVRNEQQIRDFSTTFSLRKDFDWYGIFGKKDNVTFTPVALINAGTQNFGFNTSYSYSRTPVLRTNSLPSNREISGNTEFALQSTSLVLRGSYLSGRFLLQSQVLFDYFLQEVDDENSRLNTVFSITAGITF